jgi:hypothetical protein
MGPLSDHPVMSHVSAETSCAEFHKPFPRKHGTLMPQAYEGSASVSDHAMARLLTDARNLPMSGCRTLVSA